MTAPTYQITPEQQELLSNNPHHHAVSFLDDGELLICEDTATRTDIAPTSKPDLWSVWILTRDGKVQSLAHHYHNYHDWHNETPGRPADLPEYDAGHADGWQAGYAAAQADHVDQPSQAGAPRIIDAQQASQYLLLKYRVDVSPRTIRNWLNDGKLAGDQLGDADRSPWYTTYDAIDQAATRAWFPDPVPSPTHEELAKLITTEQFVAASEELGNARLVQDEADAEAELAADARLGHLLADVAEEANDDPP